MMRKPIYIGILFLSAPWTYMGFIEFGDARHR